MNGIGGGSFSGSSSVVLVSTSVSGNETNTSTSTESPANVTVGVGSESTNTASNIDSNSGSGSSRAGTIPDVSGIIGPVTIPSMPNSAVSGSISASGNETSISNSTESPANVTVSVGSESSSSSSNTDYNSGSGSSNAGTVPYGSGIIGSITIPSIPNYYNPRYPTPMPTPMPVVTTVTAPIDEAPIPGLEVEGNGDASVFCFPGTTLVHVKDKGLIEMSNLRIGDYIATSSDEEERFEPVYSFGHYEPLGRANLLEIQTDSSIAPMLQISSSHLIFVKDNGPIPASLLQVGDELVLQNSGNKESSSVTIMSLKQVITTKGLFAPFTPSGKFLVNQGLLVSSYVALAKGSHDDASRSIQLFHGWITINHHSMAHWFEASHRLVCHHLSDCLYETYSRDRGISTWVYGPMKLVLWVLKLPSLIKDTILLTFAGILLFSYVTEELYFNQSYGLAFVLSFTLLCLCLRTRINKHTV